jgi:hypothetical protein
LTVNATPAQSLLFANMEAANRWPSKASQQITRWGGEELKKLRAALQITKGKVTFFHSMRYSFVTFLSKAEVSEEWRAAITGHQFGGMNAHVYNNAKNDVSTTLPKIVHGLEPLTEVLKHI